MYQLNCPCPQERLTDKLSPVINWIVMLVHDPVVSAVQAASIEDPSLITVDPSGVVGVTMAETRGKRANRMEASILLWCVLVGKEMSVFLVVVWGYVGLIESMNDKRCIGV